MLVFGNRHNDIEQWGLSYSNDRGDILGPLSWKKKKQHFLMVVFLCGILVGNFTDKKVTGLKIAEQK